MQNEKFNSQKSLTPIFCNETLENVQGGWKVIYMNGGLFKNESRYKLNESEKRILRRRNYNVKAMPDGVRVSINNQSIYVDEIAFILGTPQN